MERVARKVGWTTTVIDTMMTAHLPRQGRAVRVRAAKVVRTAWMAIIH